VENCGTAIWRAPGAQDGVVLDVELQGAPRRAIPLRHDVEPGTRTHFAFEVEAPARAGPWRLGLALRAPRRRWLSREVVDLAQLEILGAASGDAP
jgi:hypothetical protein